MVKNRLKSDSGAMEVERKNLSHFHTVQFYNLPPRGINFMVYNGGLKKLALSRSDASIEVWRVGETPLRERVIFGAPKASVEALVWVGENLLSAGLSGEIVHWNLRTLEPQQTVMVTGSAIWCLDVHGCVVAAGTEEGYLNICRMEEILVYERVFDRQEGRILCCQFSPSGEFLATGSVDTVRVWNVMNGNALHRMTLARIEMNKEITVWSIKYLPDNVVVSADSAGRIIFWDAKLGSLLENYQALKADALCLTVSPEAAKVFVSGTEPVIRTYTQTTLKKDNQPVKKWVKSVEKYFHSHDVKSLAVSGDDTLFSGGVDSHLVIFSPSHRSEIKFAPLLRSACAEITRNRLLLLKYLNHLEIWQLATPKDSHQLQKLLELQSRDAEAIVCATLAPNGQFLLYSTDTQIKMFQFTVGSQPTLTPIKVIPEQFSPCLHMIFSPDSRMIFLVKSRGQVEVFTMTNLDLDHIQTFETGKYIKDLIHLTSVSPCGGFLALAGLCNSVVLWRFDEASGRWKRHISLPKYTNPPTAMQIHPTSKHLVVVYLDGKLIEYDLEELQFTFSIHVQEEILKRPIENLTLDPRDPDIFLLQDEQTVFSVRKVKGELEDDAEDQDSRKKSRKTDKSEEKNRFSTKIIKEAKHLAYLSWLDEDEMVVVKISTDSFLEQLPPPLKIKKFATG
ncbi:U3 small nucleolar RNA-associated protein 4 [Sergentomyia squamirostris]